MSNRFPEQILDDILGPISKRDLVELRQCLEEDPSQARGPASLATLSNTPLMWAAFLDVPAAIELLVAHGADVNFLDGEGSTALIAAATRSTRPTIEALIQLGADIGIVDKAGRTALDVAVRHSNASAISALRDAGADPRQPNRHGGSAMPPAPHAGSPGDEAVAMASLRKRVVDARDAIASAPPNPALPKTPKPRR